jgi:ComEC/Rec2-related protein
MTAVAAVFGIFLSISLFMFNWWAVGTALFLFLTFLRLSISFYADKKHKKIVFIFLCAVFLVAGLVPVGWIIRANARPVFDGFHTVQCVVKGDAEADGAVINLTVDGLVVDGKRVSGSARLSIRLADESLIENLRSGTVLRLTGAQLTGTQLLTESGPNRRYYVDNSYYQIRGNENNLEILGTNNRSPGLFASVRNRIQETLHRFLPTESAETAYALVVGEKAFSSDDTYHTFRLSGVAHVLAVSGLHIGFVIMVFSTLTNKIPMKRWLRLLLLGSVLFFYSGICMFSPSVMRAVIMGLIASYAKFYGLRSDRFNNLGIAAILILAVNPFHLYNLSFQMSFLSVLSIICLSPSIQKMLKKIRLPARIADPVSITVAATIGLLPLIASVFHSITVWTVLSNLIMIPLITVLFIALFIFTIMSAIIPPLGVLFVSLTPVFSALSWLAGFFAGLPMSEFLLFTSVFGFAVYYACLIFPNKYSLLKGRFRTIVSVSSVLILVLTLVLTNLPSNHDEYKLYAFSQTSGNTYLITTADNKKVLAGEARDFRGIEEFLLSQRIRRLDAIILSAIPAPESADRIHRFSERFRVDTVYYPFLGFDFTESAENLLQTEEFLLKADNFGWISFDRELFDLPLEGSSEFGFGTITAGNSAVGLFVMLNNSTIISLNTGVRRIPTENTGTGNVFLMTGQTADIFLTNTDNLIPNTEKHIVQNSTREESNAKAVRGERAVAVKL